MKTDLPTEVGAIIRLNDGADFILGEGGWWHEYLGSRIRDSATLGAADWTWINSDKFLKTETHSNDREIGRLKAEA